MDNDQRAMAVLREVALEGIKERRRARRWGIFFKCLLALYFFGGLLVLFLGGKQTGDLNPTEDFTAVIEVNGVISSGSDASADRVITSLRRAYEASNLKGIVIRINSPGGSPVQAGYINDEIRRLRALHEDIPVYAVVTDVCASGGYYIAVAADEIYADKASIVGSIGVRMDSFGAVDLMEKIGVERRLYTAGGNKGMLDPFLPEVPSEVSHVESMLKVTHQQFIDVVKAGRGERLKDDGSIFSGLFWTGETAAKLGLVDGLKSTSAVARDLIEAERVVNYTVQKSWFERFAERIGATLYHKILAERVPNLQAL